MINKKNFSEQIYESLKQDILEQKIVFGDKLVNRDLQAKFGVSSTPVRDAINHLYQDGLVEDISKSGARVISFDAKTALEINEIVSLLNREAVRLSAAKSEAGQVVSALEACVKGQQENVGDTRYFDYDRLFHNVFFEFSHNTHYKQLYAQYRTLWDILVKLYYHDRETTRVHAIDQHQRILDAYACGDIRLAQDYMDQHFLEAVRPLIKTLQGGETDNPTIPAT